MRLDTLLDQIKVAASNVPGDLEITGVCCDSNRVQPGNLFAAIPGTHQDGSCYACQAMSRGAACILCRRSGRACALPHVEVEQVRPALAAAAANWYGHPAKELSVIGVTGTNGKTTSTYLIRHILQTAAGKEVGLIGTVCTIIGGCEVPAERTTPDAVALQRMLRQMVSSGCDSCVMEVSSHALSQHRTDQIPFRVGLFTNLTEDHLDYHGDMRHYCRAKARLFRSCQAAVYNRDDPWSDAVLAGSTCPAFSYGTDRRACLRAEDIRLQRQGVQFTACSDGETARVQMQIPGGFTVYNALGAMGVCMQLGVPLAECARALESFSGVPGRMEAVSTHGRPFSVLVDYAHTPDALENVLRTARGFARGRVVALFGCGGDREREKRPKMGAIAAQYADFVIVTSDNPRGEEPEDIIEEILPGLAGGQTPYVVILDRKEAIRYAVEHARREDVILLCGKGHEAYQESKGRREPMDDRLLAAALLE